MLAYEALYIKQCQTSLCWNEVDRMKLIRHEYVHMKVDKVNAIRDRLKIAQDRQKIYVNNRRKDIELEVGD